VSSRQGLPEISYGHLQVSSVLLDDLDYLNGIEAVLLSNAELWGIYLVLVLLVQVDMLGLEQLLSDVDVVAKVLDSLI